MKIPVQSIDNIGALLAEVGTDYFDLLLYHYPLSIFDCSLIASGEEHTVTIQTSLKSLLFVQAIP